ncbi:MAG: hypothetical protein ACPGTU_16185 [Myxococcota bacterium]
MALTFGFPVSTECFAVDSVMAVGQGMGFANRANPYDGGSVYSAPAMVWIDGRFDISGGARLGSDENRLFQAAAHDAQTSPIGMGVQWFRQTKDETPDPSELPGWRKENQRFGNEVVSSVLAATIGGGGVHHLFGAALGLRYFTRSSSLADKENSFNLAPSVAGFVQDQLYLSLTVENVIPLGFADSPLSLGTGTRWQPTEQFAVEVDTVTDFSSVEGEVRVSEMAGMEFRVQGLIPLRVGWKNDGVTDAQAVTAGIGASNEDIAFNYGAALELNPDGEPNHWHGLHLRVSIR